MKIFVLSLGLWIFSFGQLFAQNHSFAEKRNHQTTNQFLGITPMPFQATDLEGQSHFLPEYRGKVLVLAFWAAGDEASREQIKSLNRLQRDFSSEKVAILSLAQEDRSDLVSFLKNHPVDYPIIPNSNPLSDAGYGADMGTSRIFVMDKNGLIQKVLITEKEEEMATYFKLKPILQKLAN